jgi:hypothetical protein
MLHGSLAGTGPHAGTAFRPDFEAIPPVRVRLEKAPVPSPWLIPLSSNTPERKMPEKNRLTATD